MRVRVPSGALHSGGRLVTTKQAGDMKVRTASSQSARTPRRSLSTSADSPLGALAGGPLGAPAAADSVQGEHDLGYVFGGTLPCSAELSFTDLRRLVVVDTHVRFRRGRGEAVLCSLGFEPPDGDEKLLPNRSLESSDAAWIGQQRQLEDLAVSFDWERSFLSSDIAAQRWTQSVFLTLINADLVYRRKRRVDWCATCGDIRALDEIDKGTCRYCGTRVQLIRRSAWYLKLTAYHDENAGRLDELTGWSEPAREAQRSLLGKTTGVELDVQALDGTSLAVFTPFPEQIGAAAFVALSPMHPEVERWARWKVADTQHGSETASGWQRRDPDTGAVPVVTTDMVVQVPGVQLPLPVVISPTVDERYGQTASLGIPSLDPLDAEIARVVEMVRPAGWRSDEQPLSPRSANRYIPGDLPISTTGPLGVAVPLLRCDQCGTVPIAQGDLPAAPVDGSAHPATEVCTVCGGPAMREAGRLSPRFQRILAPLITAVEPTDRLRSVSDDDHLRRYIPAVQALPAADTDLSVLAQRMVAKGLRDHGPLPFLVRGELAKRQIHCGVVAGADDVTVSDLVDRVGADALRFTLLFAAAPEKSLRWRQADVVHCRRFLDHLQDYATERLRPATPTDSVSDIAETDPARRRLAKWCVTANERTAENFALLQMHRATRNLMTFLKRIEAFEQRATSGRSLDATDADAIRFALLELIKLLAPVAPHMAEQLLSLSRSGGDNG